MHQAFGDALMLAANHVVIIVAYDCNVEPDGFTLADPVEVVL